MKGSGQILGLAALKDQRETWQKGEKERTGPDVMNFSWFIWTSSHLRLASRLLI